MFRLATETEVLFRPIPKPIPKGLFSFRPNRNSAKPKFGRNRYFRPKTDTETVSVVPYVRSHYYNFKCMCPHFEYTLGAVCKLEKNLRLLCTKDSFAIQRLYREIRWQYISHSLYMYIVHNSDFLT